jgi:hypothetical protein
MISRALMEDYANSHSLPGLVEEYLGENYSDGEPSVQSSGNPTQLAYLHPDKMTDFSRISRFGMTFKPLTENRGEELLTLYLEDFHAKTSPRQEKEQESLESEVECGATWQGSLAKYDLNTSLWKTPQCSLLEESTEYLGIWPKWGLMQDGECWALTLQDLIISDKESGLLPTVLATDWKGGTTAARQDNGKLRFDQWRDYVKLKYGLTYPHPTHSELRMGWPQEWTDLKQLETDKFQAWLLKHGES